MTLLRVFALTSLVATAALAGDPVDPAKLYEVTTDGSAAKASAGTDAKLVITIVAKDGAYISDEAPLKIELTGTNATPGKTKLTIKDTVTKKEQGAKHTKPAFEVPYTFASAGKATMDAKMTFYLCTAELCVKQTKNLSVPVEVVSAKKSM